MSGDLAEYVVNLMWTAWMVWAVIATKVHCREMLQSLEKTKE